jgi:hypothetical protein
VPGAHKGDDLNPDDLSRLSSHGPPPPCPTYSLPPRGYDGYLNTFSMMHIVASVNGRLEMHWRGEPDARGPLFLRNSARGLELLRNG